MRQLIVLVLVVAFALPSLASRQGASADTKPAGFFGRLFGSTTVPRWSDDTGGTTCAGCSIVLGLVEQLAELYNHTISEAMDKLCSYLPTTIQGACRLAINTYGPVVIDLLEQHETSDVVCHAIDLCKTSGPDMCHAFPLPSEDTEKLDDRLARVKRRAWDVATRHNLGVLLSTLSTGAPPDFCKWPGVEEICKIIERWFNNHLPLEDLDGDKYSDVETARGTSWRGKDCNDLESSHYPGRKPVDGDVSVDSNCNGISGADAATGRTYEDLWCNGTQQMGTVLMGDSIGAHFHIPPDYLNVTELNEQSFDHLFFILENEFDWPQLSMGTGYYNASPRWAQDIHGPTDSVYLRLHEINRCNHRDYQNIGVNGARSTSMANDIVQSLQRNPDRDHPILMIFELVGNDVCNGHPGTSHMTPPEEYYQAQLKSLRYIDTLVPHGSHIIAVGLADARFLYNTLHDRIHPLGALRKDVTYTDVYNYLNCLGVSPCWGWLNSNETWRNITTEYANQLNAQLQKLVATEKFNNFDLLYHQYDIQSAARKWEQEGGHAWDLIEPVDGFHASQLGNALATEIFWAVVKEQKPSWLPPTNPHNDDIIKKFGDQGGY